MEEELPFIAHLPWFYQSLLIYLYPKLGIPIDQINILIILAFQVIIGSLWRRITNTFVRRLSGMLLGFMFMCAIYGIMTSFGLLLFIIAMYPIVKLKNKRISFWVCMVSLCGLFCYFAYFYYLSWRMNCTATVMGCVVRLHGLTWDMIDFDKIKKKENLGNFKRFTKYRESHACDSKDVTFYTYMCYMLFFVHILCGSNITINEYLYITDRTIYKKEGWKDEKQDPQPSYTQILLLMLQLITVSGIYLFAQTFFSLQFLFSTEFQTIYPQWKKMIVLPITVLLNKFKYHVGWKMLDLSLLTSGAGFSGVVYDKDGVTVKETLWERAVNIRSLGTALPQCGAGFVRNWNCTVNDWLTFYVYHRIEKVPAILKTLFGKRGSKVLVTRIAAALFHGVYPSYYFFFFWSAVMTNIVDALRLVLPTFEDQVKLEKQPKYAMKSVLLWLFWTIMTVLPIDSAGVSFMVLDFWKMISLFNSVYWFPMIVIAIDFGIFQVLLRTKGIKQSEKDKRAARANKQKKKEQ